jgi:hypothetical protein
MKRFLLKTTLLSVLAFLNISCVDKREDQRFCAQPAAASESHPIAGDILKPRDTAVLTSEQPLFRLALNNQAHWSKPTEPAFDISVQPATNGSALSRIIRIDLPIELPGTYSELTIAWNPETTHAYELISYETRLQPSPKTGITLLFEIFARAIDPNSGNLGAINAWGKWGGKVFQQGSTQLIEDPSPIRSYPVPMPYSVGCGV